MATLAEQPNVPAPIVGDERFFVRAAMVMTVVVVTAFALNYLLGRSTFAAPLRVHLHAWLFMSWVGIYLLQNIFIGRGKIDLHRRLGWIATAWIVPMIIVAFVVTIALVRLGHVLFFFRPLQFLFFGPIAVLTFAGLTVAAIAVRRRTEWHRRLHFCAMSMLLMPALGRLLPLPFLVPWAWEAAFAASMIFPLVGVWGDFRRTGHVHAAWYWGIAVMLGAFVLTETLTYTAPGLAIYHAVTAGSPGAAAAPLEFGSPPAGV